jgi:hypothetical protein
VRPCAVAPARVSLQTNGRGNTLTRVYCLVLLLTCCECHSDCVLMLHCFSLEILCTGMPFGIVSYDIA